jgi:polysaccharide biosynthesis transport protein
MNAIVNRGFDGRSEASSIVPQTGSTNLAEYREGRSPYPHYYGESEPLGQAGFDFRKYWLTIFKHRYLIAGIAAAALLLGLIATLLMTPMFRATASIQIDREAINVVNVGAVQAEENTGGLDFFQTQHELLASRTLAERVVSTLGLTDDARFSGPAEQSTLSIMKNFIFGVADPGESTIERRTAKTIQHLQSILTISPVRGSRVVKISIDHPIGEMAQHVSNGVADAFISSNLDRKYDASAYARKFLEGRIQQLKLKLQESETQLVKYAEQQGIINLSDNQSLVGADLEAINTRLSESKNERARLQLEWDQARTTKGFGLAQILDSKAIQENRKLRTELVAEYQQKLALFKPAFPAMLQLKAQIEELDAQAQGEIAAIKSSIKSRYLAAKDEEKLLTQRLETTKAEVVSQRNRRIQYNILQREVDTNRTLYDGLLQRYKEIGISGTVGTNNVSIVDHASLPERPRSPRLLLNLGLALLAGLGAGLLVAFALDFLDDTFKSPEDVERDVGLSVIGIIPVPKSGATIDGELNDQRSGVAEAFRSLRTGLQFSTAEGLPKTLLITSSQPTEGKTTSTIALAKTLTQLGLKVLIIDGDLRNASVHKHLRCRNDVGLSNYLAGAKLPDDVVQPSGVDGLTVITSGPLPPNPAELLAGPRMSSLLSLGAEAFDIVLIDGPPVMGLADSPLLSSVAQGTLFVVAANETRKSIVAVARKRLLFARANFIGVLLSKFDSRQIGYGYGYGEYDYHAYGTRELAASRI